MTTTLPPIRRRRRWLSLLLGLLIFIAGLAAGAGLTIIFAVGTLQYLLHHPENAPARITAMLTRKLSLDGAQHDQVLAIITRHQAEIQAIRRQVRPQMDQQLDQIRAQVGAILNDRQRASFDELFDKIRQRWTPTLPPPPATQSSQ
jgi:hypothetical protein